MFYNQDSGLPNRVRNVLSANGCKENIPCIED